MDTPSSLFLKDRYGRDRQIAWEGVLHVFRTPNKTQTAIGVLSVPNGNDHEAAMYTSEVQGASADARQFGAIYTGKVVMLDTNKEPIDAADFRVWVRGFRYGSEVFVEGDFLEYMASVNPAWVR